MTEINFTRYNQLCGELDRLALEFEKLAQEHPNLYCASFETWVLNDLESNEQLNGWRAFQERAKGRVGISQGDETSEKAQWEEWRHGTNGITLCFYGNPELLPRFDRLSKTGMLLLREFEFLTSPQLVTTQPGSVPLGYVLDTSTSHRGNNWVQLIFETAQLNTAFLRFDEDCYWDYPEISVDWDDLTDEDFWETNSDGVCVPLYPVYQTLHLDIGTSSAEAIRLWRNPNAIVRTSECISDSESPICIPNAVPEGAIAMVNFFKAMTKLVTPSQNLNDVQHPSWDGNILRGQNRKSLRRFRSNAKSLIEILDSFEKDRWPHIHEDPCGIKFKADKLKAKNFNPDSTVTEAKNRRREAIHDLNKSQPEIEFKCMQDGFSVSWEWRSGSDIASAITDDGESPQTN